MITNATVDSVQADSTITFMEGMTTAPAENQTTSQGSKKTVEYYRKKKEFDFHCIGCNQYAFSSGDLRCMQHSIFVVSSWKIFDTRCKKRYHPCINGIYQAKNGNTEVVKVWRKMSMISCVNCGHDWGTLSGCGPLSYLFPKARNFRLFDDLKDCYYFTKWADIPMKKIFNSQEDDESYRSQGFAFDFEFAYSLKRPIGPAGCTTTVNQCELLIPAGAVADSVCPVLMWDTMAQCQNVLEFAAQHEQMIAPPMEFNLNYLLLKKAYIKIPHKSKEIRNVNVYMAKNRSTLKYKRMEQSNDTSNNENSRGCFTIDKEYIHVFTKKLTAFCFTESKCPIELPKQMDFVIYLAFGRNGFLLVEIFVYDKEAVQTAYLQSLARTMEKRRMKRFVQLCLEFPKPPSGSDEILITSFSENHKSDAEENDMRGSVNTLDRLLCLDLRTSALYKGIVFPQHYATFTLNKVVREGDKRGVMETNFLITQKPQGREAGYEMGSIKLSVTV